MLSGLFCSEAAIDESRGAEQAGKEAELEQAASLQPLGWGRLLIPWQVRISAPAKHTGGGTHQQACKWADFWPVDGKGGEKRRAK